MSTVKYHYFHRFFTYSVKRKTCLLRAALALRVKLYGLGVKRPAEGSKPSRSCPVSSCWRSALKTVSGGEFDWGGTSVKR